MCTRAGITGIRRRRSFTITMAAVAVFAPAAISAQIINADFETGDLTG